MKDALVRANDAEQAVNHEEKLSSSSSSSSSNQVSSKPDEKITGMKMQD